MPLLKTKKKKKKGSVAKKLYSIVESFGRYKRFATLALASELSETKTLFYYAGNTAPINPLLRRIDEAFKGGGAVIGHYVSTMDIDAARTTVPLDRTAPLRFVVDINHTIERPEDIFVSPWPDTKQNVTSFQRAREKVQAKLEKITFPKEVMLRMFDIINALIAECDDDLHLTKIHEIENFIKTVALINDHDKVELSDLYCMTGLWNIIERRNQYAAVVEAIVVGYDTIAANARATMDLLMKKVRSAKAALDMGQPINYMDPEISYNMTLAALASEAIGELSKLRQSIADAADGKLKTSKHTKPLYDALSDIDSALSEMRRAAGVR